MLTAYEIRGLIAGLLVSGVTLAAILTGAALWPHRPSRDDVSTSPPHGTVPADVSRLVAEGRNYFLTSCAHCHGLDATGGGEDDAPGLRHLTLGERRIANVIKNGIEGEMPSFASKYNDAEISALVTYLGSLR